MKDGTRCDILTATHAIEVDFAKKWAEAIGQSLNYAMHTGKRPGVALIVLAPSDNKYVERVRKISAEYSLGLTIYPIDGGGVSKSVPKGGEKEFWITSSGKTHNSSCRYYGTTQSGHYLDLSAEIVGFLILLNRQPLFGAVMVESWLILT